MMANRLEATILIDKPAEDVFTFLHNPENPQDWQDEFRLYPYGLMEPPVIIACEG